MFKISTFDFGTMSTHRQKQACVDEFLATVPEGLVQGISKVVTRWSFGVRRQHKASGGKWTFHNCVTRSHMKPWMIVEGQGHFAKCR